MPASYPNVPVLAFVGFSGSGKTTFLEKLIQLLSRDGINLALIKHAHHEFDIDIPGKDSYRLRHAGASQVMVASRKRRALIIETPSAVADPVLDDCLAEIDSRDLDLILIEGFKHADVRKIEIHRNETQQDLLYPDDENIIALVTDNASGLAHQSTQNIPVFDINTPQGMIEFIVNYMNNNSSS